MRAVADMSRQELEQTLAVEISSARSEARPISRHTLIRLLQSKYPINQHEAEKFVDQYCDDKAPGVPTYLSSEFGVPYLKVLAVINVVVGLGLAITAAIMMSRGGYGFLVWLGLSLAFFGGGAICWLQSVRPEKAPAKRVITAEELANLSMAATEAEPVATGSLQSRS